MSALTQDTYFEILGFKNLSLSEVITMNENTINNSFKFTNYYKAVGSLGTKKTKCVQIKMQPDLHAVAKELSNQSDMSFNQWVINAIVEKINAENEVSENSTLLVNN